MTNPGERILFVWMSNETHGKPLYCPLPPPDKNCCVAPLVLCALCVSNARFELESQAFCVSSSSFLFIVHVNPLLAGKINGVVSTPLILVFWLEKKFNGVVSTPLIFHPKNRYILDGVETTPLILEIFSFITLVTQKIN